MSYKTFDFLTAVGAILADNSKLRQEQKRLSRVRNKKTTIQISHDIKDEIVNIQNEFGFRSIDEALDEIVTEYLYTKNSKN